MAKVGPSQSLRATFVDPCRPWPQMLPKAGDTVTLDILLGPRTDWFTEKGLETLLAQDWQVTAESSRVGVRLAGVEPLERGDTAELPSERNAPGARSKCRIAANRCFSSPTIRSRWPSGVAVVGDHLDLAGQIPICARIQRQD
ncbi:hypothetical protein [Mesorhizobium abyssinicae]|uniref:hypothetical protein n=1 Tax=Mesorhizobium abyssinicae TaxID=1209958 RepID=UPI0033914CC0